MYRFSRQIFVQIKDAIDPHPDTITVAEARRRVLRACEDTIERLTRDARYFPKPARSLFQEVRYYFPIKEQARVYQVIEQTIALAQEFIRQEIERAGEGADADVNEVARSAEQGGPVLLPRDLGPRPFRAPRLVQQANRQGRIDGAGALQRGRQVLVNEFGLVQSEPQLLRDPGF